MTTYSSENCGHPENICSQCTSYSLVYVLCRKPLIVKDNNVYEKMLISQQELYLKLADGLHLYGFKSLENVDPEEVGLNMESFDPISVKVNKFIPSCLVSKSLVANTILYRKALDVYLKEDDAVIEIAASLRLAAKTKREELSSDRRDSDIDFKVMSFDEIPKEIQDLIRNTIQEISSEDTENE
jgi:hypothetical protein